MPAQSLRRTLLAARGVKDLTVIVDRAGSTPLDLSGLLLGLKWSTLANGGFAGCTLNLPGTDIKWRSEIPYLSIVRVLREQKVIYEGRVEDMQTDVADGQVTAEVAIFGLSRLLDDNSVHKAYVKRDLAWTQLPPTSTWHPVIASTATMGSGFIPNANWQTQQGRYDSSDQSKLGIAVLPPVATVGAGEGGGFYLYVPSIGAARLRFDTQVFEFNTPGGTLDGRFVVAESQTGGKNSWSVLEAIQYSTVGTGLSSQTFNLSGYPYLLVGFFTAAGRQNQNNGAQFSNIRLSSLATSEDAAGGLFGDTVLRDMISAIPAGPGLYARTVETGSDFTIQQCDASTRRLMRDVLGEVTAYYNREWAVWEDGAFDWVTKQLDDVSWVIGLGQFTGSIKGSVEDTAERFIVQYQDVSRVNSPNSEAIYTTTDQRNPWVRSTGNKDKLLSVGFPMTPNTATQLAQKYGTLQGGFVPAQGQITIRMTELIQGTKYGPAPAYQIRGGDTVSIPELYADDPFGASRDGQTVFHVISSDVDVVANTVSLTLDTHTARADVLLARLAEVTNIITSS